MKNNKENEELQSRREFFKEAAKKALPVIGAIALASSPILAHAAEKSSTSCNGSCSGLCTGSCSTSCQGGCKGTCTVECNGACVSSCKGACSGGCRGYCGGSCKSSNYNSY